MKRTSVLLADDHTVLTESLTRLLQQEFDVVGIAEDGRTMVEMAKRSLPDVIVADISMPQLNGMDAARILRKEVPSARLLFLTMHADLTLVEEALRIGAMGFLLKVSDTDELVKAIHSVAKGETYISPFVSGGAILGPFAAGPQDHSGTTELTMRQREILQLLAEGKTMKEAAMLMQISTRTAESHKYEIMRRLGVQTTAALIRHAVRIKLV